MPRIRADFGKYGSEIQKLEEKINHEFADLTVL
jgi:hypothetical protein